MTSILHLKDYALNKRAERRYNQEYFEGDKVRNTNTDFYGFIQQVMIGQVLVDIEDYGLAVWQISNIERM